MYVIVFIEILIISMMSLLKIVVIITQILMNCRNNLIWKKNNINKNNIGMGRTKFKHVEIDKKISEAIQRSNQSEKHEASIL